jgi:hypothetical protein
MLEIEEKAFYLSLIKELLELTRAETNELDRSFKMAFYPLVCPFRGLLRIYVNG